MLLLSATKLFLHIPLVEIFAYLSVIIAKEEASKCCLILLQQFLTIHVYYGKYIRLSII